MFGHSPALKPNQRQSAEFGPFGLYDRNRILNNAGIKNLNPGDENF